ncbi:MAG: hypothetical protein ACI9EF_001171 [Pseudohongiellaceae bacterium]|jgi:hypothetical protein
MTTLSRPARTSLNRTWAATLAACGESAVMASAPRWRQIKATNRRQISSFVEESATLSWRHRGVLGVRHFTHRLLASLSVCGIIALSTHSAAQQSSDASKLVEVLPLQQRSGTNDGPRFQQIDSALSGIDFQHQWRPETKYLHVLGNSMAGGGVAVGDIDGDDLPELLFTTPYGGSRLYRNLGDLRFADMSPEAGLESARWGGGASFGDLDNDGDLDLYVCGYDTPNRLYWNDGTGKFTEGAAAAGLDFVGAALMMAFCDYDLDGDLDGYLLTNRFATAEEPDYDVPVENGRMVIPDDLAEQFDVLARPDGQSVLISAGQYDHLYRNNGDGTFSDVSESAGLVGNHYGLSATWWDPDDNGLPDLYVANDFFGPDQLWINQGDGTFREQAAAMLPHTPWFSMGSDAGDINNDGLLDFIASDMASTSHYRRAVTMTDLSNERWFLESSMPRQYMRNALYVNTGTGRFGEAAYLAGVARSDWTWSTVFGDLDNDGRLDLFISNGMSRDYFNYDLRAEANQHSSIMGDYWIDQAPLSEANLLFRNDGELRFTSVGPEWGLGESTTTFGATLADLDRDGDLDIIANNFESPASLFENRSNDGHSVAIELRGHGANRFGLGARVQLTTLGPAGQVRRQVRQLTLSRGYMSGAEPRLHFGLGDHTVIERLAVRWPGGAEQVLSDLPIDACLRIHQPGTANIAAASAPVIDMTVATLTAPFGRYTDAPLLRGFNGPVSREAPYDDYARQPLLPERLSQLGPCVAMGDVNGDGVDDLFLGGPGGQAGQLFLLNGSGRMIPSLQQVFDNDDYYEDTGALFLDADRDGDLDLYLVSGGIECRPKSSSLRDRLYLNDGAGNFSKGGKTLLPGHKDSGLCPVAADIDHDGDLDLFVGTRSVPGNYPEGGSSALLLCEGGGFVDAPEELAPGLTSFGRVTAALFTDVDDDGWADLLVAHDWGPVRLWHNDNGRLTDVTEEAGLSAHLGWWSSLSSADIDHDGDLDVVVGNLGLNTERQPSPEAPVVLYSGDLDGTGESHLIEAHREDGRWVPVRTRNDVLSAMPFLAEDFPSFSAWGQADLSQIFGDENLALAEKLTANTAESVLLRNDGAGHFTAEALPRQAQISPGFGAAFTELNGDGHPDLVWVSNSFSPHPVAGRRDGGLGLVLLGDGRDLQPLRPDVSGLLLPGDGKGLALGDLDGDGWSDLAVGMNNGPMRLLTRHPARANTGTNLTVRLSGKPGNPNAVGARVTLRGEGLPTQTIEVQAGAGYLGQSSPTLFFGVGLDLEAAAKRVHQLTVRWPNGELTEHTVAPGARRVSLP